MPQQGIIEQPTDLIHIIRRLRNELIKDFLDERILMEYLSTQFRMLQLSHENMAFIKSDLQKLLIAPVDLARYEPIVKKYADTGAQISWRAMRNYFITKLI